LSVDKFVGRIEFLGVNHVSFDVGIIVHRIPGSC
jgi:hypothetical protein